MVYTEKELITRLGQPATRGHLLGDGSRGWKETPWAYLPRAPLGNDRFLGWDCIASNTSDTRCLAIFPTRGSKAQQGWFIVLRCSEHERELDVTPFEGIFPIETSPPIIPSPSMFILKEDQYEGQSGPDWEPLQTRLQEGWRITLVYGDHRFPDYKFVVVERQEAS